MNVPSSVASVTAAFTVIHSEGFMLLLLPIPARLGLLVADLEGLGVEQRSRHQSLGDEPSRSLEVGIVEKLQRDPDYGFIGLAR